VVGWNVTNTSHCQVHNVNCSNDKFGMIFLSVINGGVNK
jgi:hypothetical protein